MNATDTGTFDNTATAEGVNQEQLEAARKELFAQNGISEEDVGSWREVHGDIGWVSFMDPSVDYPVVFIFRILKRREWKLLQPTLNGKPPAEHDEIFASTVTLFPTEALDPTYWDERPAFFPETITQIAMNTAGAQPSTPPMRI